MKATVFAWLNVVDADRRLFRDPVVDTWEGGFADLIRLIRHGWQREGSGPTMPVDDWTTYKRIKEYASDYGEGTWQKHVRRWAAQLPDNVADPQQGLF